MFSYIFCNDSLMTRAILSSSLQLCITPLGSPTPSNSPPARKMQKPNVNMRAAERWQYESPRTDTLELGLKWTLEMICHKNTPLTLMTPWIVGHLVTRRPLSSIFYASLRTFRGEQGFLFQSFCKRSDLRTLMLNMMFWARKSDMVTRWRRRLWGHDFEERRIKKFLFLSFNQTLSFHKALRALANTPTWREVK